MAKNEKLGSKAAKPAKPVAEAARSEKPKAEFVRSQKVNAGDVRPDEAPLKEQWPDNVARKIIEAKGDLPGYTIAAGITPSGVVHIGNFREIITVDLVARALKKLGKKVRFIYSWDDYDVFRKIPANFPQKEMLEKYLRQPIVDVPDPFVGADGKPCHSSYAEHNEKAVEDVLPLLGVSPIFLNQAKKYRACEYAEGMKTALQNKGKVKAILDEWRAEDLEGIWNPVRVFCSKCNTDRTTITNYDGNYTLAYSCECGFSESFDFRKKGIGKLQWRVDWPMRWAFEKVTFEPSGKEHSSQGGSNTTAEEIVKAVWGYEPPFHIMYEFIAIKGTGGKMSSSKGNTVDLKEMMSVYEPSVIRYLFVRPIPSKAFDVSFDGDVITFYEAFDRLERVYFGVEPAKESELEQLKSIYEFSAVEIPRGMPFQPSFRHITTILQLNLLDEKKAFGYFRNEVKSSFDEARLRARISCAKYWLMNYAPDQFLFRVQDSVSDAALSMPQLHKDALREFAGKLNGGMDEEKLGSVFKEISEKRQIPIADLFRSAYMVLVNKERGPKLFNLVGHVGAETLKKLVAELNSRKLEKKHEINLPGLKQLKAKSDFEVSPAVRAKFPSLRVGVVVVEGIDNSQKSDEIVTLIRSQEASLREKYFGKDFASLKGIKAWRDAYSAFGAKPKEYRSSVESLVRRVLKGDPLPSINPLVDLYNCISIKYILPAGSDDLGNVEGPVRLRFADGGEPFMRIGSSENDPALNGEVIYSDNSGALCRRWNWRECDRTKLTEDTERAIIYVESLNADDRLAEAVSELAELAKKHLGAKASAFIV
ncbi:Lysine--tRNA ligase [uncultured archaeon]|nr:Lysine--tRNA ligase [uncultured archaeon]